MTIHRGDCGHIKLHWDNHKKCINCSHCSRESTCSMCSSWSNSIWELAERELILPERVMSNRKKSLDVSVSSDEKKRKHGNMPLMALLPGVRPILVATPWVLVPKGVRPPTTGHWASDDQPTSHRPLAQ